MLIHTFHIVKLYTDITQKLNQLILIKLGILRKYKILLNGVRYAIETNTSSDETLYQIELFEIVDFQWCSQS